MKIHQLVVLIILITHCTFAQLGYPPAVEQWSKPKKLVYGTGPSVTWDGKRIYFVGSGICYIEKIDTGWSEIHQLGPQVNNQINLGKPVLSPDGKTLIFSGYETQRLFRSKWNEQMNDWDTARIFTDNGISSGNGWWEVGCFLSNTTLMLEYLSEGRITYWDTVTGLWSTPDYFPQFPLYTLSDWGSWVSPNWKKHYYAYGGNNVNLIVQYFDSSGGYGLPFTLNISTMSDSLYNIGEYRSRHELKPFLTPDGRTMYFQANYDTLGAYFSVWESKMIVDENGDTVLTDIKEEPQTKLPEQFLLSQNYPNPFNPTTKIKYTVADANYSSPAWVTLKVYDILGNEVATLVNEYKQSGSYEVEFQSTAGGRQLASGVYYYQLKVGNFIETKKMLLVK